MAVPGSNPVQYQVQLGWVISGGAVPTKIEIDRIDAEGTQSLASTRSANSQLPITGFSTGRTAAGTSRAGEVQLMPSRRNQPTLMSRTSTPTLIYSCSGTTLSYVNTNVQVNHSYTYNVVAWFGNVSSTSAPATAVVSQPVNEVTNVQATTDGGSVTLTWQAPSGITGRKFKVYRSVSFSTIYQASSTDPPLMITNAQLNEFTDISQPNDIPWGTTTFTDSSPDYGMVNTYVVVVYDANNNPSQGPYMAGQVRITTTGWTGTIASVTPSTPIAFQQVYFSAAAADQLAPSINTSANITLTCVPGAGTASLLNAKVQVHTDRGSFVAGAGQTVSADQQTVTGVLNGNSQIVVTFQGRPENGKRTTFTPASQSELQSPVLTVLYNGGVGIGNQTVNVTTTGIAASQTTVPLPSLIGPPSQTVVTSVVPAPPVPQPDAGVNVLFQNEQMTVNAVFTDAAGQPVMNGMPIWFVQSWSVLNPNSTVTTAPNTAYFDEALGPGSFGAGSSTTTTSGIGATAGTATTTFACNKYSGLFTLTAFALSPAANADASSPATLGSVNLNSTGGWSDLNAQALIEKDNYLLPSSISGNYVTGSVSVMCKTFASYSNWVQENVPQTIPRLNAGGQDNAQTLTYYAYDEAGKRVLPGTYYSAAPVRNNVVDGAWEQCGTLQGYVQAPNNGGNLTVTDGGINVPVLQFNNLGESSFSVQGDGTIGQVYLQFQSQMGVQNLYQTQAPVVVMYGPSLDEATPGYGGNAIFWVDDPYVTGTEDEEIGQSIILCGPYDTNTSLVTTMTGHIQLFDASGNPFPPGYLVKFTTPATITTQANSAQTTTLTIGGGGLGYTDKNGRLDFTYKAPNEMGTTGDEILDYMHIEITGENSISTDYRGTYQNESYNRSNNKPYPPLELTDLPPLITTGVPSPATATQAANFTTYLSIDGVNVPTSPTGTALSLPLNTKLIPVTLFAPLANGDAVWPGTYNIKYSIATIPNPGMDTVMTGTTGILETNATASGQNSVTLTTGKVAGYIDITAFYQQTPAVAVTLADSGWIAVGAPSNNAPTLTATPGANDSIQLAWNEITLPFGSTLTVSGYQITRSLNANMTGATVINLPLGNNGSNPLNNGTYTDSDPTLVPYTTYYYQVKAAFSDGTYSLAGNTASAAPVLSSPTVPTAVAVQGVDTTSTEIDLSWTGVQDAKYYIIQRIGDTPAAPLQVVPATFDFL